MRRWNKACSCIDLQSYALSVRVLDEETNTFSIKHYRIKKLPDGQVGVSSKKPFSSVVELVAYYRGEVASRCVRRRARTELSVTRLC